MGKPDAQTGPELELLHRRIGSVGDTVQSIHEGLIEEMVELRRLARESSGEPEDHLEARWVAAETGRSEPHNKSACCRIVWKNGWSPIGKLS